jgi:hypothetical protein
MRIATYNVEWFSSLFARDNRLLIDDHWSGRQDVTRAQQIEALAHVFSAMDADAIMVIEAPNTGHKQSSVIALENFANAFDLRTNKALGGFANETQQEITLLYDPYIASARHDPIGDPSGEHGSGDAPRFDGLFNLDLDMDTIKDTIAFSKPPLEVELTPTEGTPIRLIGVHAKSKVPHGATTLNEQVQISIANRRKQLAQCIWLRQRVDAHLAAKDPLIVLGDFNDGPGLDEYEDLFGRSGVEIVLGSNGDRGSMLFDPHAMMIMSRRSSVRPTTSRFFLTDQGTYMNALLDYIMVSPDLRAKSPSWSIWHPFDNPHCYDDIKLRKALLAASDHFPVTLDIAL